MEELVNIVNTQSEYEVSPTIVMILNVIRAFLRSFIMAPLVFFYIFLAMYYSALLIQMLGTFRILSRSSYQQAFTSYAAFLLNKFDMMSAIKIVLLVAFVISLIYGLISSFIGLKQSSSKAMLLRSSVVIILLWVPLLVFTVVASDGIRMFDAIRVFLVFTGFHLGLNLVYYGSSILVEKLMATIQNVYVKVMVNK